MAMQFQRWPRSRFFFLFLFVVLALTTAVPPLTASKEHPTLNELMESGELEKEISDEPPVPRTPDATPVADDDENPYPVSLSDEDQEPVPPAPAVATYAAPAAPAVPLPEKTVVIGRVPFMNVKEMLAHYQGLLDFLKKEMGVKDVKVVTGKDYAGVLNALERGTIDFAWLGPMAYTIGNEKMPLTPLAQAKRRTGATYRGVFIARKDAKILGIEDIKGKTIGFVDPESASGYLYPLYFLNRSNINPHKDCKKVEFLKKHDSVLAAVIAGKVDVGVCLEDTLVAVKDRKILEPIMMIGKTYEVPSDVVACRVDCDPILRDKFQEALLKTATLKQTVNPVTKFPPVLEFMPIGQATLDSVRGVLNAIKDIRQK